MLFTSHTIMVRIVEIPWEATFEHSQRMPSLVVVGYGMGFQIELSA